MRQEGVLGWSTSRFSRTNHPTFGNEIRRCCTVLWWEASGKEFFVGKVRGPDGDGHLFWGLYLSEIRQKS